MNKILGVFLVMSISFTASADTENIEKNISKAAIDAIFVQHKIAKNESIRAIIKKGDVQSGRTFIVQYIDEAGKCTQDGVDVFIINENDDGSLKTNVTFFDVRQKCE